MNNSPTAARGDVVAGTMARGQQDEAATGQTAPPLVRVTRAQSVRGCRPLTAPPLTGMNRRKPESYVKRAVAAHAGADRDEGDERRSKGGAGGPTRGKRLTVVPLACRRTGDGSPARAGVNPQERTTVETGARAPRLAREQHPRIRTGCTGAAECPAARGKTLPDRQPEKRTRDHPVRTGLNPRSP